MLWEFSMNKLGTLISIYLGGLLIGLVLVSFPSSSGYLVQKFGLTGEQYGSIYLPQLVLAIIGAIGGGTAVRFMSLKAMWTLALLCFFLSQASFIASAHVEPKNVILLIMMGTAFFGFGFGFGGGPVNGLAAMAFPKHSNSAITALHVTAGLGMTLGPLVFAKAIGAGNWSVVPYSLAIASILVFVISLFTTLPKQPQQTEETASRHPSKSGYFWLIMVVAVFYALAEGTFSNWAIIYAQETKSLSTAVAGLALSAFWGALTIGRLITTFALVKIKPIKIWLLLPPLMALALFLLPHTSGSTQVILAFAFAGLACSSFFPLMVAVTSEPFPTEISYIGSMLTAALMFGVGIGSYVIGRYRDAFTLDDLYTYSIAYPLIALLIIFIARRKLKSEG